MVLLFFDLLFLYTEALCFRAPEPLWPSVPTRTASGCAVGGPGGGAAAGLSSKNLEATWSAVALSTAPSAGLRLDLRACLAVTPFS